MRWSRVRVAPGSLTYKRAITKPVTIIPSIGRAGRQIFLQAYPGAWPAVQIPAIMFESMVARFILVVFAVAIFHFMLQLITILNRCHRFPGFVYQQVLQFRSQEH